MPVVSIICVTYNHSKYIREAVDGFIRQETNFPVEVIVHDDASTDGSIEIIREYAAKYPDIFCNITQKQNQWSQGLQNWHRVRNNLYHAARGEFIATCEGDDYWSSTGKLQRQVQLLEAYPEASASYHQVEIINPAIERALVYPTDGSLKALGVNDVLKEIGAHTSSLMFRRKLLPCFPAWSAGLRMGDWPLVLALATKGPILPIEGVHSAYRVHEHGAWSGAHHLSRLRAIEEFYSRVLDVFPSEQVQALHALRKANLFSLFRAADHGNAPADARRYLWRYFVSRPHPFRLPPHQMRAVARCLYPKRLRLT